MKGHQYVKPCSPDWDSRTLDFLVFREVSEPASITVEATCGDCIFEFMLDYAAVNVAWEDGRYHDGHAEGEYGAGETTK